MGSAATGLSHRSRDALCALLFLYREVLGVEPPWLDEVVRAKRPQHLPVVLTRDEVRAVLERLDGVPRVMAILLYGAGLRLLECCRLRVQDIDFVTNQILIRDGKGRKDRVTMLPAAVKAALAKIESERIVGFPASFECCTKRSSRFQVVTVVKSLRVSLGGRPTAAIRRQLRTRQ